MELKAGGTLFAVRDLKESLTFYRDVLGMEIVNDFGANVVLSGGLSLQTLESWAGFLGKQMEAVRFGGNDAELYYEADDFDAFLKILEQRPEVELVHPAQEHGWGQRAVRLYDPDRHIIEVGESMAKVARRFFDSGLSEEGVARRMDVSLEYVRELLK
ncbi:VOC family protein [uncultured Dysosmobacter sp.]|uniref:VOC family protein n=1 Tax=uncultured Dysosmobacter sp. TaxID=2591384 RepID=UPI0026129F47|nr:VOC family protein [uncultured Dysosmobacter sp.]